MFAFSTESEKEIQLILEKYPVKKSALLPLLHVAQRQAGYITPCAMREIARRLDVSPAYVRSVCSFYTMYHTEPVGRYVIRFCINISCYLNDSDPLLQYLADKLGIKPGQTTADKKFTLIKEECLAECGAAPVMRINDDYHVKLTRESIDRILASLA
jgi:NADH-quinone oxidoreductase E subunit